MVTKAKTTKNKEVKTEKPVVVKTKAEKSEKFAVISAGGKQYVVREGEMVKVEKIIGKATGEAVEFDALLVVDGDDVKIGNPLVKSAKVSGKLEGTGREEKVIIRKFKSKTRYRKKQGHRQEFALVKIEKISA